MADVVARFRLFEGVTIALAAGATLAISVLPAISFGYRSASVHVGIETAATFVSVLVAYLLYGRFRSTRRRGDFQLFIAVAMLAVANLAGALAPAVSARDTDNIAVWIPLTAHLLAAATLAAAAFAPDAVLGTRRTRRRGMLVAGGAAVLALAGVALLSPYLPTGVDPNLSPASSETPRVVGAPGLLAGQLVVMTLLVVATVGFARRLERTGYELMGWLAAGATLLAFGRLNYFLFPSNYSEWVFTGDLLRLSCYIVILIGALRQISAYQQAAEETAVLQERRRIARDLHDGLAQDLAFISMQGRRLSGGDPGAEHLVAAADRALAGSRAAITTLSGSADAPLGPAIAEVAGALTARAGADLELELDERIQTRSRERDGLLYIVSEAISNSTRHGKASAVSIRLRRQAGLRLTIADDGKGFAPRVSGGGWTDAGFGLTSMRERAESLGGEVEVRSRPGRGTVVEVVLR